MVCRWTNHGYTMAIQRSYMEFNGMRLEYPLHIQGIRMVCFGIARYIPWYIHGYTLDIPWVYHWYSMVKPLSFHVRSTKECMDF